MTTSTEWVLTGPRAVAGRSRRLRTLADTWARVRIAHCGICGSDLSKFEGRRAIAYPASIGHEFVGVVEDVGSNVTTVRIGDTVTSDLNFRCGRCPPCVRGQSHLCVKGQQALFSNRAFAQFADFSETYVLPVAGPPSRHLALAEPLSCALHALSWASPTSSDRLLVIGAGGLGLSAAFALANAPTPIPFEIIDRIGARARLIEVAAGIGRAVTAVETDSFDIVVELSGAVSGLRTACQAVRPGGRLVTMSHLDGYGPTSFLLPALTRADVAFKLSYLNGPPANLAAAADMLATAWGPNWEAATATSPLHELQRAFDNDRRARTCKTIVDIS